MKCKATARWLLCFVELLNMDHLIDMSLFTASQDDNLLQKAAAKEMRFTDC